jgi:hypothetical protein
VRESSLAFCRTHSEGWFRPITIPNPIVLARSAGLLKESRPILGRNSKQNFDLCFQVALVGDCDSKLGTFACASPRRSSSNGFIEVKLLSERLRRHYESSRNHQ